MTKKLSAVLIVKNEEAVLARCLKSLDGIDEIVVFDTGSTDKTVEVARASGAVVKIGLPVQPFHFANARNEATNHASHDWILSIDADEVLRAGSLRKIREAIAKEPPASAIRCLFLDRASNGRSVGIHKEKIFKRSVWKWRYRVHEQIVANEPNPVIRQSDATIEHIPVPNKGARHRQNVELLKLCIEENPEYARAYRHLGLELMLEKKWEEAIPFLATYIDITEEEPLEKSEGMLRIGQCYAEMNRMEEALKWFDFSAETDARRREPLYQAAWYLIKNARAVPDLEKAIRYLYRLSEIPVSKRPFSSHDYLAAWNSVEPLRMITFCEDEIKRALTPSNP